MNTSQALWSLTVLAALCLAGIIVLATTSKDIPDVLPLVATTAVGAIGGILAPTKDPA